MQADHDVVFNELKGRNGNLGEIFLNRPKALNALTQAMCTEIRSQLNAWGKDRHIKAVIIKGAGDRAFCAGGDIRKMYELKMAGEIEKAESFFEHEYAMNATLFHFPKPYISFLNGITMGGGAGVSIHGSHRIATEKFIFAMPESSIGFFTDIGASHFLTQCPYSLGSYLALTGNKINASDAFEMGLITHIIPSDELDLVQQQLLENPFKEDPFDSVTTLLNRFHKDSAAMELMNYKEKIEAIFSAVNVETIIDKLNQSNIDFLKKAGDTMTSRSPTSLKVIFEQLRRAKMMEFDDIMQMEFTIASNFLKSHDFFEGIRAALIDKDQNPHWQPEKLSDISTEEVNQFFHLA